MAALEDARHYVTIKPVPPWELAKDAKLKARSFDQYNLGSPTRYDMFKSNYMRRLRQMTSQGFRSSQSKPYEPVGALVLNVKDLVKKTLGQEREDEKPQSPKRPLKDQTMQSSRTARSDRTSRRPTTSPIYSSRQSARARKPLLQLQDIPGNLNIVENTKYSVKMGHSLFEVLETNETSRSESQRGRIQSSDLRSVDGDRKDSAIKEGPVMKKQDIEEDRCQKGPKSLPVPQWLVNVDTTVAIKISQGDESVQSHSESSIDSSPAKNDGSKTYFLWRQLCALHWLIEACRIEQGLCERLTPGERLVQLAECWNTVKPGGSMVAIMQTAKLERNSSVASLQVPSRSPSRSTSCTSLQGGWSVPASPRRFREAAWSVESPHSPSIPFAPLLELPEVPSIDYSQKGSNEVFDIEDTTHYHNNLVKLLDTVKESVQKELQFREKVANKEAERRGRLRDPVYQCKKNITEILTSLSSAIEIAFIDVSGALSPYPGTPKPRRNNAQSNPKGSAQLQIQPAPSLTIKKASIRPHTAGPTLKHTGQSYRSESPYHTSNAYSPRAEGSPSKRPRSSPPKLSLRLNKTTFSSDQREKTMVKLREQFQEVTVLKALRLHQSLTELQRSRSDRIEKKFEAFQVRQLSMHRDLKVMRSAVSRESSPDRASSRMASPTVAALSCEWYSKLLELTSAQEAEDKSCTTVMRRLEESAARYMGWQSPDSPTMVRRPKSYNILDNQITVESFVRVVRQLRSFEVFAPDVSAAIDFMKKEIVKMPNEQFEELVKKLV